MPYRILHCCPTPLDPKLGTAKVYLESAAAFRHLGWTADVVSLNELDVATKSTDRTVRLREYLQRRARDFDVVEYEHNCLPFVRTDFSPTTLMVARSVLLTHHLLNRNIPSRPGLVRAFAGWIKGPARRRRLLESVALGTKTMAEADLVNCSNDDDAVELGRHGIDAGKIAVFPFGLTMSQRRELEQVDLAVSARPCVAFVGTFDPRKGMSLFPRLVELVTQAVPDVRFRLIGTAGMLPTAEEVFAEFPQRLRPAIEVVPRYDPAELPSLLSDASVGVFPSLLEGFGLGVLEMLAAGMPVIAFRVPGPPMMLADDDLVACNDIDAMAAKAIALLTDRQRLASARSAARRRSRDFDWNEIIGRTAAVYESRLSALRAGRS
jgi:glycosyltransferase involved in cell wall biosynthesis